jgi:hypothetical protein
MMTFRGAQYDRPSHSNRCLRSDHRQDHFLPGAGAAKRLGYARNADDDAREVADSTPKAAMSAFGPKQIFQYVAFDVAFRGRADMPFCTAHACF